MHEFGVGSSPFYCLSTCLPATCLAIEGLEHGYGYGCILVLPSVALDERTIELWGFEKVGWTEECTCTYTTTNLRFYRAKITL